MRNERERLSSDEEVDLVELVRGVWRQKIWVLLVALPVTALGFIYAQLATPVYEAKLYVHPPLQGDIARLNYGRGDDTDLSLLTVKDVYDVYLRALQSEAVRGQFFRAIYLPSLSEESRQGSRDALYRQFGALLKVAVAGKDAPNRYVITASLTNPQKAADWVSNYARMASDKAEAEVLKGVQGEALVKANNLEHQIVTAQSSARKQRADEIIKLKEALSVARSIGLEKPPIISGSLSAEISASMDGSLTYMRGSRALESEIANLESRPSDDPFIPDLRALQEQLAFYRNLRVEPSAIAMFQQDGAVERPDDPIKPKKSLIILLSAIVGLGLGVLVALAKDVWGKRKKEVS